MTEIPLAMAKPETAEKIKSPVSGLTVLVNRRIVTKTITNKTISYLDSVPVGGMPAPDAAQNGMPEA